MTVTDVFSPHYVHKPGPKVSEYRQVVKDPSGDETKSDARHVGDLRVNHSRLNLVSSLDKGDDSDFYKFRMVSNGPVRLGMAAMPESLKVEVMDSRGTVLATNDESVRDSRLYERFQRLTEEGGESGWKPGEYYIKVSRTSDSDSSENYKYAFQLQSGNSFRHDYETIEQSFDPARARAKTNPVDPVTEALAKAPVSGRVLNSQAAASLMTEGYGNMQTIFDSYLASRGWGNGGGGFFA